MGAATRQTAPVEVVLLVSPPQRGAPQLRPVSFIELHTDCAGVRIYTPVGAGAVSDPYPSREAAITECYAHWFQEQP